MGFIFCLRPQCLSYGSIVIFGGQATGALKNDTWRFQPVGSNSQNPVHQYVNPGIYSVSEMVTGSFGSNTLTKVNYTLGYNLTSMFTPHGAVSTWYPNGIAFTDTSYVFPPLSTWNWSWGDGTWTNGSNGNPYHFWFAPGVYNVSMTANNTYISGTNYTEVQVMRM